MIGTVGRDPCQQLRGLLHSQQVTLMEAESRIPHDEKDIAAIKKAIEKTKQQMTALGYGDD